MWKKVEAILRPYKIQEIIEVLNSWDILFYLEECKGFGKRLSPLSLYRKEPALSVESLPRTRIMALIPESELERVTSLILEKGGTGIVGDGKIFVLPVLKVIDIYSREIHV